MQNTEPKKDIQHTDVDPSHTEGGAPPAPQHLTSNGPQGVQLLEEQASPPTASLRVERSPRRPLSASGGGWDEQRSWSRVLRHFLLFKVPVYLPIRCELAGFYLLFAQNNQINIQTVTRGRYRGLAAFIWRWESERRLRTSRGTTRHGPPARRTCVSRPIAGVPQANVFLTPPQPLYFVICVISLARSHIHLGWQG